ncbi:MFS transporter [Actinopolymorpha alba]|uniref:MFS transporter n=1 Tax=Actinopolymorpha alba TaxID=533267 RepID=UPI000382BA8E|nr:MFS transporter [Actinopolymorpha alba]
MTNAENPAGGTRVSPVRLALASLVGTTLEWYDFLVYGTVAALVFDKLFFPEFSHLAGTLASFATLAVGFAARPLGSIIFGHFGDRFGRQKTLVVTLVLMGGTTFVIGLLPSYQTIGVWAPILLTVLRFIQGLGLGGEWGGAALMSVEHAPAHRRALYGSATQMGSPAGQLLSTAFVTTMAVTTGDSFATWGWRVPFLASALLLIFGLVLRMTLPESPEFARIDHKDAKPKVPLATVVRRYPKTVGVVFGISCCNNIAYWTGSIFTLSYVTSELGKSRNTILTVNLIVAAIYVIAIPFMAMLADRVGPRRVMMTVAGFGALFAFPFFTIVNTGNTLLILAAVAILVVVVNGAVYTPQPAFFAALFPAEVRYTGASVSYALPTAIVGGTAPFIGTALYAWAGSTWPIAVYMTVLCLVSFGSSFLAQRLPTYLDDSSTSTAASGAVPTHSTAPTRA